MPAPLDTTTRACRHAVLGVLLLGVLGVAGWRVTHRPPVGDPTPRSTGYRIDVNHADADTLQLLPGVGPTIAKNMVEYRQTQGRFASAEDLEAVRMIGPVLRDRVAPWVVFGPAQGGVTPAKAPLGGASEAPR